MPTAGVPLSAARHCAKNSNNRATARFEAATYVEAHSRWFLLSQAMGRGMLFCPDGVTEKPSVGKSGKNWRGTCEKRDGLIPQPVLLDLLEEGEAVDAQAAGSLGVVALAHLQHRGDGVQQAPDEGDGISHEGGHGLPRAPNSQQLARLWPRTCRLSRRWASLVQISLSAASPFQGPG